MEKRNLELKSELERLKSENEWMSKQNKKYGKKEAVRIFKHLESLNGDFGEYINNVDEDDIKNIQTCCDAFMKRWYKTTKRGRDCLLYTSPSPRDMRRSRMPSSA